MSGDDLIALLSTFVNNKLQDDLIALLYIALLPTFISTINYNISTLLAACQVLKGIVTIYHTKKSLTKKR